VVCFWPVVVFKRHASPIHLIPGLHAGPHRQVFIMIKLPSGVKWGSLRWRPGSFYRVLRPCKNKGFVFLSTMILSPAVSGAG
jgi:hypothetical protein